MGIWQSQMQFYMATRSRVNKTWLSNPQLTQSTLQIQSIKQIFETVKCPIDTVNSSNTVNKTDICDRQIPNWQSTLQIQYCSFLIVMQDKIIFQFELRKGSNNLKCHKIFSITFADKRRRKSRHHMNIFSVEPNVNNGRYFVICIFQLLINCNKKLF